MNDLNEFSFTFGLLNNCLAKELEKDGNSLLFKASLKRIMEHHENAHDSFKKLLAPFLISFSFEGDMLSQWRGYCPHGGYSLGFSFDELSEYTAVPEGEPQEWSVIPVSYASYDATPEEIAVKVKEICNAFKKALPDLGYDPYFVQFSLLTPAHKTKEALKKELEDLQKIELDFGLCFYIAACISNPNYKHQSFQEEKEVRIATLNNEFLQFKCNEFHLKPYKIFKVNLTHLKEIIIGPTNDYERCRLGLIKFLEYHNLNHVKVKESKIPYRNTN